MFTEPESPLPPNADPSAAAPRRRRRRPKPKLPILLCGGTLLVAAAVLVIVFTSGGTPAAVPPGPSPSAIPSILPTPSPVAETTPTPTPTPTPEPVPNYDFTLPAPETAAVGDEFFADAVFVGDSRTDGLKLFGGITGATFIEHTGITVFEVGTKSVIRIDGAKYTVLEALALKQYSKVYLMLGVNELGYFDDEGFATEYAGFVDKLRQLQPNAVIYLQNLVSIHPAKAKANDQPYYVTNEQIAVYNDIIADIAVEKHTVLVDVNAALVDETGILPREGTTDGVHFTKEYYVKWYDYLKIHTVDSALYWAGQISNGGVAAN